MAKPQSGTVRTALTLPPEKLVVVLRDGRKMIGVLRSWDQFGMARAISMRLRFGY